MMKKILPLIILTLATFSCNNDDINVVLNTSGITILNFDYNGVPVANAEVRVSSSQGSTFQMSNSFEGFTDENGEIRIGPLNAGTYYYRLDLDTLGFLIESFEAISGTTSNKSFDVDQYLSSAQFEIGNLDPNLDYSSLNYYLVPSIISVNENNIDQVIANSIRGNFETDKITFPKVVAGQYLLYIAYDSELILISGNLFYGFLVIERDYDFESTFNLPPSLILILNDWTTSYTAERFTGTIVNNWISSISFTSDDCTIFFVDDSSFTTSYVSSSYFDGTVAIFLNNGFVNQPAIYSVLDITYTFDRQLEIVYENESFEDFRAVLE